MNESSARLTEAREYLRGLQLAVDDELGVFLDSVRVRGDDTLQDAIRYTVLGKGKRIRPVLTLAVADLLAGDRRAALKAGCAIELMHSASLILDDLPCMDDAALRRGKAANHLVFGEDVAILASVNLLSLAFGLLADCATAEPGARPQFLQRLLKSAAESVGADGLVGGQLADLRRKPGKRDFGIVDEVHERKTVRLFMFAAEAGALIGNASIRELDVLIRYARNIGLAFQILDDILDVHGDPGAMGKNILSDASKGTFLKVAGMKDSVSLVRSLVSFATDLLTPFGDRADRLCALPQLLTGLATEASGVNPNQTCPSVEVRDAGML